MAIQYDNRPRQPWVNFMPPNRSYAETLAEMEYHLRRMGESAADATQHLDRVFRTLRDGRYKQPWVDFSLLDLAAQTAVAIFLRDNQEWLKLNWASGAKVSSELMKVTT